MKDDSKNVELPTAGGNDTPALPTVVDRATWQAERDALLVREKAHTHEGDAIAAARRQLPMVEVDPTITLIGPHGPVTLLEAFEGRRHQPRTPKCRCRISPGRPRCVGRRLGAVDGWNTVRCAPRLQL
jgi:hypothetical protein